MSLCAWRICCSPYSNLLAIKAAILNPHLHFQTKPMSNDPSGLFYISVSWLNSSILRFKEQRRQNSHRKLWFMVLLIFLSNFLSLIISIFQFKYFSLSFLYWSWHFHSSSFAHWMWLAECFENNYFIWIYSTCTTIKLSSTLVNASVKHFYHFMWILHVPFRACFNVLTCWWQCPSSYPHDG